MDTDNFVLSVSEIKVFDVHMDLTNLDTPDKTIEKVPGILKH